MLFIHKNNWIIRRIFPKYIWKIPTKEKILYLTFDDGPIPDITEFALAELAKYQAKATFFCIGDNIQKHPQIFQKVIGEGHSIGNHTFNHLNGWKTANELYVENLRKCQSLLPATHLFRPPYGRISKNQAVEVLKTHQIIMWDVLTGDYNQGISPEVCLQKTIQYAEPGSIILFHDSHKAARNMSFALPRVLSHFSSKGFRFEALPMIDNRLPKV